MSIQYDSINQKLALQLKASNDHDDPDTLKRLRSALESLEDFQAAMIAVNECYLKNKTLEGCPHLSSRERERLPAGMAESWRKDPPPYENCVLANNLFAISQIKSRIEMLTDPLEPVYLGWEFDGGYANTDQANNQLQVSFDSMPDQETCAALQSCGFQWDASGGLWQRPLDGGAFRAADQLTCIQPLFGGPPSRLRKWAVRDQKRRSGITPQEGWQAIQYPMTKEERLSVSFCRLIRERFPALLEEDASTQAAQVMDLTQMFLRDGVSTARQMILTVAGLITGAEVESEVKEQAENLMSNLAHYQNSLQKPLPPEHPGTARCRKFPER